MSKTDRKYAFLMVQFETPSFIKELQNKIKDEELYVEDDNDDYGIEKESHVTVVPCLDNDVDLNVIKTYLDKLSNYEILLTNISKFECEKYDVLKCDVFSKKMEETNHKITEKFKTHTEYKEYHPHLTIAYLKKGMCDKYLQDIITPLVILKPKSFHFSYVEDDKEKEVLFKS